MAKIVDLRGSGGHLVLIGDGLVLPTADSTSFDSTPAIAGSLRFNPTLNRLEFVGTDVAEWKPLSGVGGGGGADLPVGGASGAILRKQSSADQDVYWANAGSSTATDILDRQTGDTRYSLNTHNHSGVYSPVAHSHAGVYQPSNATLSSLANATVSSFALTLLDDSNAATALTTLGLGFASQGEAQIGSDNTKLMTPLRVAQAIQSQVVIYKGMISGLNLVNNSTNPNSHIDVTIGVARSSDNTVDMVLNSPITKSLNAVWVAGTNTGGLDTGTKAINTGYHVYLILNPTTSEYDALFSTSATAPSLPTGFTKFRRLGAVMTDGSGNIMPFVQTGDWFMLKTRTSDFVNEDNGGGVARFRNLHVPQGRRLMLKMYMESNGTADATHYYSGVYDPEFGVPSAFSGASQWAQIRRTSSYSNAALIDRSTATTVLDQFCNSSRQVYTYSNDPLDFITLGVLGWNDDRSEFS